MMVAKNLQSSWDATNGLIAHSITKDGVVGGYEFFRLYRMLYWD